MAIIVGSARHDENGRITGGKAGDQTGSEVATQTMYLHPKGWYISRPKSIDVANAIAQGMKIACANDNIGYDQNERYGIIKNGVNSKVKTEADCSTTIRACCIYAGFDPGEFYTGNEVDVLERSGHFEKRIPYVSQAKTPVYDGDILTTKSKGHTVAVVSGNPRKSASSASKPSTTSTPTYKVGKNYTLQAEMKVRTGAGTNYRAKKNSELTTSGKAHDKDKDGALDKGTVITCQEVKKVDNNIWIKCPSGWIAAYYNGKKYVK